MVGVEELLLLSSLDLPPFISRFRWYFCYCYGECGTWRCLTLRMAGPCGSRRVPWSCGLLGCPGRRSWSCCLDEYGVDRWWGESDRCCTTSLGINDRLSGLGLNRGSSMIGDTSVAAWAWSAQPRQYAAHSRSSLRISKGAAFRTASGVPSGPWSTTWNCAPNASACRWSSSMAPTMPITDPRRAALDGRHRLSPEPWDI